MANIVLITVVLVGFYSVATAETVKEIMGHPVCEYIRTKKDCDILGECMKDSDYTVNDACDEEEVHALNIEAANWGPIFICDWEKNGQIKADGSCDLELEKEYIDNRMSFESPEVKAALIAANDKCKKDNEGDCIASLFCGVTAYYEVCYPDAKFHKEDKAED